MCFTVSVNIVREELEHRYGAVLIDPDKYRPSYYYHAMAMPAMPVICNDHQGSIDMAVWGLIPDWIKDDTAAEDIRRKTFNARAETLDSKPAYSKAFESRRCLIPVTGFFEWQHINGKKIPWYISMADEKIFSIAGLWENWISPGGITLRTFSLITVAANEMMAEIHNTKRRMPAILPKEVENIWIKQGLSAADASMLLEPVSQEMLSAHTVSPAIGNSKVNHNLPEVIKPYSFPVQGSLF